MAQGAGGYEVKENRKEDESGGRMGERLRVVRKRKRARRGFECEVMVSKMRLVKVEEKRGR